MKRTLFALTVALLPLTPSVAQMAPAAPADTMAAPSAKPKKQFEIIDAANFDPARLLPAPAAAGSAAEALELAQLRQLIAGTSAARMEQAKWDDEHEDPSIFDSVSGHSLKDLPATWALLKTVQNDAGLAGNLGKTYFKRVRPWGADAALPNCDAGKGKSPMGSYPSGHSVLGYSVGWTLAQLQPEKAQAILARAHDYALSREICGVHFRSDTAASQVLGTFIASTILADPRIAPRIAAAKAELAKR